MGCELKELETKKILYGLAIEIKNLSEKEKLLHLKWVLEAEEDGGDNRFWLSLAKKMLVSDEFTNKVITAEKPFFTHNISYLNVGQ